MYDPKTDEPARVNTTDINEDLGQVQYLFSDKTGTLTENEMVFKHFGLEGKIYEEMRGQIYQVGFEQPQSIEVILFLLSKIC
jgi:phospholipid-translocating ATPase